MSQEETRSSKSSHQPQAATLVQCLMTMHQRCGLSFNGEGLG
nr:hypothetical protein [Haliscomenobacter sp.]